MEGDLDPFLMVTAHGSGSWIVERWDEPGFREEEVVSEDKFKLIEDWLGRSMTAKEREIAKEMLDMPTSQFGGSYSAGVIARRLDMLSKAGKKTEPTKEKQ